MLALGELGEASFGTYKLGKLAIFRKLEMCVLGEVNFRMFELGDLGELISRMLKLGKLSSVK